MVGTVVQQLTEYVEDQAGAGLRTVVTINEDGYEPIYLRGDLQEGYSKEMYEEVVETFRLENPLLSPGLEGQPVGERRALLHYHESACVIQLPYSETETILISVSRDAGRDLVEFIERCRQIVDEQA